MADNRDHSSDKDERALNSAETAPREEEIPAHKQNHEQESGDVFPQSQPPAGFRGYRRALWIIIIAALAAIPLYLIARWALPVFFGEFTAEHVSGEDMRKRGEILRGDALAQVYTEIEQNIKTCRDYTMNIREQIRTVENGEATVVNRKITTRLSYTDNDTEVPNIRVDIADDGDDADNEDTLLPGGTYIIGSRDGDLVIYVRRGGERFSLDALSNWRLYSALLSYTLPQYCDVPRLRSAEMEKRYESQYEKIVYLEAEEEDGKDQEKMVAVAYDNRLKRYSRSYQQEYVDKNNYIALEQTATISYDRVSLSLPNEADYPLRDSAALEEGASSASTEATGS